MHRVCSTDRLNVTALRDEQKHLEERPHVCEQCKASFTNVPHERGKIQSQRIERGTI